MNSKSDTIDAEIRELFVKYGYPRLTQAEEKLIPELQALLLRERTEAEKAIRQAVGEEMLKLVGEDDNTRKLTKFMVYDGAPQIRNQLRDELRQKIEEWQGGEGE